jgi:hypothetical protein
MILRVSTGRLDQSVTRLDTATLLSLLNHAQSDSILDATASAEKLGLNVDIALDTQRLGNLVKSNKRGVADKFSRRVDSGSAGLNVRDLRRHFGGLCVNEGKRKKWILIRENEMTVKNKKHATRTKTLSGRRGGMTDRNSLIDESLPRQCRDYPVETVLEPG